MPLMNSTVSQAAQASSFYLSRLAVPSCLPVSNGKPPCLWTISSLTRLKRRRSILTITRNLTDNTLTKSGESPKNQ
jgi:hypothetical protein